MPGRGKDGEVVSLSSVADMLSGAGKRAAGFFDAWFGPLLPPREAAPAAEEGRGFDYPAGWNLRRTPRSEEDRPDVAELRALAKVDLIRLCIETRKDIMSKAEFEILPRKRPGETRAQAKQRGNGDDGVKAITDFFMYPDKEHDFLTWMRLLLEDALVIDAATLYCRRTRGGGVHSLEVIDGGTITRYLDATARTPRPPKPAYGQWIKGAPYKNYTTNQLLYYPRNPVPNLVYGCSPTEQIILTSNMVLNRNISQLAMYTVSNIPQMFIKSPKDWKPSDIRDFQLWFDSVLSGNIEERTKAVFIPDAADPMMPNKDNVKDDQDEWFARLACYCYGVAPNFFIRQQNRASSESYWQQADEEGALPWLRWFKAYLDFCLARYFKRPDLEFTWWWERKPLPLQQSQILSNYVTNGILTRDEARQQLGYDPLTPEQLMQIQTQGKQEVFETPSQRPEEEGDRRTAMDGTKPPRNPTEAKDGGKSPSINTGVTQA